VARFVQSTIDDKHSLDFFVLQKTNTVLVEVILEATILKHVLHQEELTKYKPKQIKNKLKKGF